jgi:hypothetical protein
MGQAVESERAQRGLATGAGFAGKINLRFLSAGKSNFSSSFGYLGEEWDTQTHFSFPFIGLRGVKSLHCEVLS